MVHKRPFDEELSNEVSPKQPRQHEVNNPIIAPLAFPYEGPGQSPHASVNMVHKRPFDEEISNDVSLKQPRQPENNDPIVAPVEFACEGAGPSPRAPDECDQKPTSVKCEGDDNLNGTEIACSPEKDVVNRIPDPCSSPVTRNPNEEMFWLEAPFHVLLSPECHNSERPSRTNIHPGEMYSFLLGNPPRKPIPVGPEFQANIPLLEEPGQLHPSDYEKLVAGSVVISMPELNEFTDNDVVGAGRKECLCEDVGSVKCVEQHILEVREKLKTTLGFDTFAELGFCDMGDLVAEKWSTEEEHLFHEVVFSNPASSGRNFWDNLTIAFPSRTKMEIISYYFNVFMLRRRAEQNRFASMEIDSDNDDWPETLDAGDDEEVETGGNDMTNGHGLVAESPMHPDRKEPSCDQNTGALQKCSAKVFPKCSLDAMTQSHSVGLHSTEQRHRDIQDESVNGPNGRSDNCKQWTNHFNGHEFMMDSFGYVNRTNDEIDFLPTCSMIEEVFGSGTKAGDGRGSS